MKLYITLLSICIFISCKTSPYKVPPGGYYVPGNTSPSYINQSEPRECFSCQGTGQKECYICDGTGQTPCYVCQGSGLGSMCYSCQGAGRVYFEFSGWSKCSSCNGRGYSKCFSCNGKGFVKCMSCSGRGWNKCTWCNGRGYSN